MAKLKDTEINGILTLDNGSGGKIDDVGKLLESTYNCLFKGIAENNLANVTDLDNLTTLGIYNIPSGADKITNCPAVSPCIIRVLSGNGKTVDSSNNYIRQEIEELETGITFNRIYNGSAWSGWRETVIRGDNGSVAKLLFTGSLGTGSTTTLPNDEWKRYNIFMARTSDGTTNMIGMRYDASSEVCIRYVGGYDDASSSYMFKANTTINPKTNVLKNIACSKHKYMTSTSTAGQAVALNIVQIWGII